MVNLTCTPGAPVVQTFNSSLTIEYDAPEFPEMAVTEVALKITFYVLAMLVDLVGNFIVILIILLNRKMRTTTNVFILNLAVSDLLVGMFCMWVHLGNQISNNWPFGYFMCIFSTFAQVTAVTTSVLTLTVISVERFVAIVFPFRAHWPPVTTGVIIACTWLAALATASPNLFVRKQYVQYWRDRTDKWCDEQWPQYYDETCSRRQPGKTIYYVMVCVVMYFLPIAVMIAAYTVIAVRLYTRRAPGSLIANTSSSQDKAKRKVIKMLVAVLITFVINWTPQQFLLLFYGINWRTQVIPQYLPTIKYVAVYMAYFNSALNPILYGGFNENFRKGFIEAFRCLLIKRSNRIGVESGVPRWSIRKPTNIGEKSTIFPKTSNCSVPSPNISLKHIDHSTESHDTASRPASPGFQQTANLFVTNVKAPDMLVSSCHLLQHSTHEGQQPHSPHVQPHSPHVQPHSPHVQPHSQHVQPHSQHVQPHSPHVQPHSPHVQPHSPHLALPTSKLQIPQGKQDLTTASTESSVVQSQENSHHSSIETPIISANKKV